MTAIGYASVWNDGAVWHTQQEEGDNYLAELGAQIETAHKAGARRIVVEFDAI